VVVETAEPAVRWRHAGGAAAGPDRTAVGSAPPVPLPEPTWPPLVAPAPPIGLYVHVPFCVARCPYCDFAVVAGAATRGPANRIGAYVEALLTELELRADALDAAFGVPGSPGRPRLETCYIGGGTPSLLGPTAIERLLRRVADRFGLGPGAEVTLEANPGPDERGDPVAWRQVGVTRLSFGGQSLDRAALRALGRRHGPEDVLAAIAEARAAGIGSINVDLLFDLPGQTLAGFAASLEGVLAAGPDHVSCYALELDTDPGAATLSGASPAGAAAELGDRPPVRRGALAWRHRARAAQDPDRAAAMYELAADRLAAGGFRGYELSNWARPGHESRHNLLYWARRPVEALGPGAHAFDGRSRRWTAASLDAYLAALRPADGKPAALPPGGVEVVDPAGAQAEAWILGLRTARGMPARAIDERTQPVVAWALGAGLVEMVAEGGGRADRRVRLTRRGRLLANEVFVRFV
jgi:oxygen-independent coproporphyrinogen-3 oxidase